MSRIISIVNVSAGYALLRVSTGVLFAGKCSSSETTGGDVGFC